MKKSFFICFLLNLVFPSWAANYKVSNLTEYNTQVKNLKAGDSIVLASGVWKDAPLVFYGEGTSKAPITLTVEEYGKTTLEGLSNLQLYGNHLIVDGLVFINGYTPTKRVIEFRKGTSKTANYSTLKNCVIDRFNQPDRTTEDAWVNIWGQHNRVEQCYFGGKTNQGVTLIVWPEGEGNNANFHVITKNYFAPRPRLGSNGGETIRVGTSTVSMQNSNTLIEGNYFERCNGETEIVSIKSCENRVVNNTFFECEGSVVLRHGNRNEVSSNYFIGNMKGDTGGVRVINEGHKIFNNYFYGLRGKEFRGPLVIMNGVPNSVLNRYHQVKNCEIAFNTWIDCELPWQFCVGSDQERSAIPVDNVVANNIVYCPNEPLLIKAFDKLDGIKFEGNILVSEKGNEVGDGFLQATVKMGEGANGLPLAMSQKTANEGFEYVKNDLDGRTRGTNKWIGSLEMAGQTATLTYANKKNCGPAWYTPAITQLSGKVINVKAEKDELAKAIRKSKAGDILELQAGEYVNTKKMNIPHTLTIRAAKGALTRPIIKMESESTTTTIIFEIGSDLRFELNGVAINGEINKKTAAKYAFTTSKESGHSYTLLINNCDIYGFKDPNGSAIFKAYKGSFADSLTILNSTLRDSYHGLALNEEKDEKGLYSAEFITLSNTVFKNIEQWAVDFLRGGNDESTLGGNLIIDHCVFDNVNNKENQLMIKQLGLVNIGITNTIFCNSISVKAPIKLVGQHNKISYSNVYHAGKIATAGGAKIGEGMNFKNPNFVKKSHYKLDPKSTLLKAGVDGSNIGLVE